MCRHYIDVNLREITDSYYQHQFWKIVVISYNGNELVVFLPKIKLFVLGHQSTQILLCRTADGHQNYFLNLMKFLNKNLSGEVIYFNSSATLLDYV